MQGQRRPCQDSICSMPACLWPGATASGHGSVLETLCLLAVCLENALVREKGDGTLLRGKEVLTCSPTWGEERQDPVHVACGSLDGTADSRLSVLPPSEAKWLIHFCSTPITIVWTHTCSIVRDSGLPALGWSDWFLIYWLANNGCKWVSPSFLSAVKWRPMFWWDDCGDLGASKVLCMIFCLIKNQFFDRCAYVSCLYVDDDIWM